MVSVRTGRFYDSNYFLVAVSDEIQLNPLSLTESAVLVPVPDEGDSDDKFSMVSVDLGEHVGLGLDQPCVPAADHARPQTG